MGLFDFVYGIMTAGGFDNPTTLKDAADRITTAEEVTDGTIGGGSGALAGSFFGPIGALGGFMVGSALGTLYGQSDAAAQTKWMRPPPAIVAPVAAPAAGTTTAGGTSSGFSNLGGGDRQE